MEHHRSGRLTDASRIYFEILAIDDRHADSLHLLGVLANQTRQYAMATQLIAQAIAIQPKEPLYYLNFAGVLQKQGRLEEAVRCYRGALALRPEYPEVHNSLGYALQTMGRFEEAGEQYERAIGLAPEFADAHVNRSLLQLLRGKFDAGWRNYEWRWRVMQARERSQSMWRGEALGGARILLYAEQGLGDTIQFLRYVPLVQAAGGMVVLEVPESLQRLAAMLPGVEIQGEQSEECVRQCPLMSLPLVFGTTLATVPAEVPYLTAPYLTAPKAARPARPLEGPIAGLRVGLVWAGSATNAKDQFRSMTLEQLAPLVAVEGVRFYSLQMGEAATQLAAMPPATITDLTEGIGDMADTAARIAELDLVIAVDTAVAHLAGALGRPVWLLLPFAPDWRWLLEREDSPWYPTMRLFRQPRFGDWDAVVERVRGALAARIDERAH
jgi:TPR repeat/Glycosyltransferase family 9 (heptosyltransferase)